MDEESRKTLKYLGVVGALAGAYFVTAIAGLRLDAVNGFATLVWPPTGIAFASLFLLGSRYWPGVALGAFLANFVTGASWPIALGIAFGNTAEALLGAYLLRRVGFRKEMDRLRDALAFIGLAAIASTLVSASVGVLSLWLGGTVAATAVGVTWSAWWVGDILGNLVFGTLLLALFAIPRRTHLFSRRNEALALTAIIFIPGVLTFINPFGLLGTNPPIAYLMFIPLVWAALRFGLLGTTLSTVAVSAIAIWGTVGGSGPFVRETVSDSLLHLQLYVGVIASTAMILAAVDAERRRAEQAVRAFSKDVEKKVVERTTQLAKANQDLERAVQGAERRKSVLQAVLHGISEGVTAVDMAGNPIFINPAAQRLAGIEPTELLSPLEKLLERTTVFYPDGATPVPMADLPITRALRGEVTSNERLILKSLAHPDGIMVSVSGSPITDERGDISGSVVVFREIPRE